MPLAFSASTNRITTSGYNSYDLAGNQLGVPGLTFQYNAAGRIKTVNSGTTGTYTYDGDGVRVKRVANGETRYYFHDSEGHPAWEFKVGIGWQTFNHYFQDRHVISHDTVNFTLWLHSDHLGTPRVKTNVSQTVVCREDYGPYGEPLSTCADGVKYRFTGKERDNESGLDYFGARYYWNSAGRFTSPDPENAGAGPEDPQSWNGYAYARNNPLLYSDPDGLKYRICDSTGNCGELSDEDFRRYQQENSRTQYYVDGQVYARNDDGTRGKEPLGTYDRVSYDVLTEAAERSGGSGEALTWALTKYTAENLGWAISPAAMLVIAAATENHGSSEGLALAIMLPPRARKILGGLLPLAEKTVSEAVRLRGGGGSQVNMLPTWLREMKLGEVAIRAADGNKEADAAVKMVKRAAQKAQRRY